MKKYFGLILMFILFSCQEKTAQAAVEIADTANVATSAEYEEIQVQDSKMMAPPPPPPPSIDQVKFVDPKIIKNASLRFEVKDLALTYKTLLENCKKNNAIIQNDTENNDDYRVSRSMIIRVPSANFDAFIADISKGVNYFERKEISSQDVTSEYIDHQSRIASKTKLENRYLELLKKATKVQEMLEIEKQLSEIREEIEAKQGQLNYLQNQVSMSTVALEFFKNTPANGGARTSFFGKIWNAIVSGFNSIANFFVKLIELWPFILILVAIIYFIRRRIIKKKQA